METTGLTSRQKALLSIYHSPGMLERSPGKIAKYPESVRSRIPCFLCGTITYDIAFLRELEPGIAEIDLVEACDSSQVAHSFIYATTEIAFSCVENSLTDFLEDIRKKLDFKQDAYKELWFDVFLAHHNNEGLVTWCKRLPRWKRRRVYPKG